MSKSSKQNIWRSEKRSTFEKQTRTPDSGSVLSNPWKQVDNFKTLFSPVNSRIGKLRIYVKLKHVEQELFLEDRSLQVPDS